MNFEAYTYLVKNHITNQFYYGSRKSNIRFKRTPEEDLWIHYFTSSNKIKKLITVHGVDSFEVKILHRSGNYDECYWKEQELIEKEFSNPLCLNSHYIDPKSGKNKFSFEGHNHSTESIQKIRKNRKGGMTGRRHSQESKDKIKNNHKGTTGLTHSASTIKKMSDIKLGNTYGRGSKGKKRKPQSEESNKKRSNSLKGRTPWNKGLSSHNKGKPKPKYTCQHCQKTIGGLGMLNRWHGTNCNQYSSSDVPH